MSENFWKSRLTLQLILGVLLSLGVAFSFFVLLQWGFSRMLDQVVYQDSFQAWQEQNSVKKFQKYVTDHGLSITDKADLDWWVKREGYVNISLYQDHKLVYNSTMLSDAFQVEDTTQGADIIPEESTASIDTGAAYYYPWNTHYDISMKDGVYEGWFSCYYEQRYYDLVNIGSLLLAGILFVIILFILIHRKTRYINRLAGEIKILEGGDLSYAMTVQGKDELGALAKGIDDMRRAIIEQQTLEKQAQEANRELITAMSHDLRTPLTALIGYLDLIELEKYEDEKQLAHFIHCGRDKAYQIKEMSDKLFEYFLVYGKERENMETQSVDGMVLLEQIVEDSLFDLESQGIVVERNFTEVPCTLQVNVDFVRRVFDNVFSNIVKYGDAAYPVKVSCGEDSGYLQIAFSNQISVQRKAEESTGIGLKTCEKILEDHGGLFRCEETDGKFQMLIRLPMEKEKEDGGTFLP